ncbi:FdrA family protein [Jatrophihabitans sp. DSM 45814]
MSSDTQERVELRRGLYQDSVTLMQLSRDLTATAGVTSALVAMATDVNLEVLRDMGFRAPEGLESPNELIIAIRGVDRSTVEAAMARADELLAAPRGASNRTGITDGSDAFGNFGADVQGRTIGTVARDLELSSPSQRCLALISVPGQHAFTEAVDALDAGCDVMIFSDNVTVEHEVILKDYASERGLLVMGPDCGTAVLGGVGLGFSHTLGRGPVGLVAASGTGAQQVLCLLDAAGVGVTAAIGTGGRDLSAEVAGRSTIAAMRVLDIDPDTELIMVVSKPPSEAVATELKHVAATLSTPVHFALLGPDLPDLTAATEQALAMLDRPPPRWPSWPARSTRHAQADGPRTGTALRGFYCGGTLCDEAMLIATAKLGPIYSNTPLYPEWALDASLHTETHLMIDFGDDALTRGRPHPMIDASMRNRYLLAAITDPETAVLLLDVVLGHGAHPDPVAELLPIIAQAEVPVVLSLIGARLDPQSPMDSAARLSDAGAAVFTSNAAATRHALALLERSTS